MPSEIRVDTLKNTSGLGTVTYNNTGTVFSGDLTSSGSLSVSGSFSCSGPFSLTGSPIYRNLPTITTNYTVTTTYNELSVGPITINNGITVTVDTGATWTVI
jgi:hypothetical protein